MHIASRICMLYAWNTDWDTSNPYVCIYIHMAGKQLKLKLNSFRSQNGRKTNLNSNSIRSGLRLAHRCGRKTAYSILYACIYAYYMHA